MQHSSAGIQFTLTFLLGLGGGYLLDRHLGTTPGFTANGGVLGFVVGVWGLFRRGRKILKEGEEQRSQSSGQEPGDDRPS